MPVEINGDFGHLPILRDPKSALPCPPVTQHSDLPWFTVMQSITSYSNVTSGDNFSPVSLAHTLFQEFGNGVNSNVAPIDGAGLAQLV